MAVSATIPPLCSVTIIVMTTINLLILLMIVVFGTYAFFLCHRVFGPQVARFVAFSQKSDSLMHQIIPAIALVGLLLTHLKITVF